MSARSGRLAALLALVALLAFACGPSMPTTPPSSPNAPPSTSPSGSAEPSAPTTQTDTDWGRIWDGLPAGFPVFTGSRPAGDGVWDAVSGAFVIEGGDSAEIASWYQSALEGATYSTESMSGPLEDDSFEIESTGDDGCRILTSVVPQGSVVFVAILYGAKCPAS